MPQSRTKVYPFKNCVVFKFLFSYANNLTLTLIFVEITFYSLY